MKHLKFDVRADIHHASERSLICKAFRSLEQGLRDVSMELDKCLWS